MEFYFLRHGATPGNLLGQYIGITEQPLAPEGVKRARALAGYYPTPDLLWVSPMERARQTAALLFPGIPQRVVDTLHELDFGEWEEKTWEEVGDMEVYDRWVADDRRAAFPGGECLELFNLRTAAALRQILQEAEAAGVECGVVLSHGGVNMSLMHQFAVPQRRNIFEWMSGNYGGFHVEIDTDSMKMILIEELRP